jgi:hypothetical protein
MLVRIKTMKCVPFETVFRDCDNAMQEFEDAFCDAGMQIPHGVSVPSYVLISKEVILEILQDYFDGVPEDQRIPDTVKEIGRIRKRLKNLPSDVFLCLSPE